MSVRVFQSSRALGWIAGALGILGFAGFVLRLVRRAQSGRGLETYLTHRGLETNAVQVLATMGFVAFVFVVYRLTRLHPTKEILRAVRKHMGGKGHSVFSVAAIVALGAAQAEPSPPETRITIISDAFSRDSRFDLDWGFAALVEHGGRRILFDTGNNAEKFARNAHTLGVDLTRIDFVVISHRHGDHTDGLHHLLTVNPGVPIYAPDDEYFGGPTPPAFFAQPVTSLPKEMRYFGGAVPATVPHGSPWRAADIRRVGSGLEVAPGVRLVANRSKTAAFSETPEISLVLATPDGPIIVVGCSHPGIEQILESVDARRSGARLVVGGLHLVTTPADETERLGRSLRDDWAVKAIAPGHCTGEVAFASLMKAFGNGYTYGGVGTTIRVRN